jgi:hypothetical protein
MLLLLFEGWEKRPRNRELDLLDIDRIKWAIPPRRKFHAWGVGLLILDKAYSDDILLFILKEKTNPLETACVSGPPAGAGDTPWETFRFVPI